MIAIVCVDDNYGMLFNQRRQSQDSILRSYILDLSKDAKLWMNSYSANQFEESEQILVDEDFLTKAPSNDFCFVETIDLVPYEDKIDKIILCHWNRKYPSTLKFNIPLQDHGWTGEVIAEFEGSSHKNIVVEEYSRN